MAARSVPPSTPEAIHKAAKSAFSAQSNADHVLDDCYDLILPFRTPDTVRKDARVMDRAFDSTAPQSALRFAGRLQNDIMPPFQQFFTLELGPAAKRIYADADARKREGERLEAVAEAAHAAIDVGTCHTASHEMFIDLVAGQGAMLISEGDIDEPAIFESVPSRYIATRDGRGGRVEQIHYCRKFPAREIAAKWPERTNEPEALAEALREGGDASEREFEVTQSTFWNSEAKRWELHVVMAGQAKGAAKEQYTEIHRQDTRTCPWIVPRFFKLPGQSRGVGPAQMALPDVRVANKTVELTLRAAALAILGLWTRTPDINAGTTLNLGRLAPGSMMTVARNGGPLGPSLAPLDVPRNFDISNLMLAEYRERIRDVLFDRAIPRGDGKTPRSASEVIETLRMYAEDLAAVYGRLVKEIIVPLVSRVIEILYRLNLIPDEIQIDQLLVAMKVVSPLADAQNINDLQRVVRWLELVGMTMGEQILMLAAKVEDIPDYLADLLGVPKALKRGKTERDQIQKLVAEIMAQMQMAAQGGAQGGAPAPAPA